MCVSVSCETGPSCALKLKAPTLLQGLHKVVISHTFPRTKSQRAEEGLVESLYFIVAVKAGKLILLARSHASYNLPAVCCTSISHFPSYLRAQEGKTLSRKVGYQKMFHVLHLYSYQQCCKMCYRQAVAVRQTNPKHKGFYVL